MPDASKKYMELIKMQKLTQEMVCCESCKKPTLHQGNVKCINWIMHIALMFVFGLGFVTLFFAVLNRTANARIGGKRGLFCNSCGNAI